MFSLWGCTSSPWIATSFSFSFTLVNAAFCEFVFSLIFKILPFGVLILACDLCNEKSHQYDEREWESWVSQIKLLLTNILCSLLLARICRRFFRLAIARRRIGRLWLYHCQIRRDNLPWLYRRCGPLSQWFKHEPTFGYLQFKRYNNNVSYVLYNLWNRKYLWKKTISSNNKSHSA